MNDKDTEFTRNNWGCWFKMVQPIHNMVHLQKDRGTSCSAMSVFSHTQRLYMCCFAEHGYYWPDHLTCQTHACFLVSLLEVISINSFIWGTDVLDASISAFLLIAPRAGLVRHFTLCRVDMTYDSQVKTVTKRCTHSYSFINNKIDINVE